MRHLANAVIQSTKEQGAFLPASMRKGAFIFFAIDNSDFNEDTPDGKRTLHATATALCQRKEQSPSQHNTRKLRLHDHKARDCSLKSLTDSEFIRCYAPNTQAAKGTAFTNFQPGTTLEVIEPYSAEDQMWLLSRAMMCTSEAKDVQAMDISPSDPPEDHPAPAVSQQAAAAAPLEGTTVQDPPQPASQQAGGMKQHNIPTWTGYSSLLSSEKPLTEVAAIPLIASPAHEWQTLITVLKQTQHGRGS